jgi:two-component system cell cycle response regulator
MRILIADDETVSLHLLGETLKELGHEVVATEDGRQAWQELQEGDIHLVVADWMMPHLDGPQLCQLIRRSSLDRYVYIILLTARDRKEDMVEGLTAGADDYMIKPFNRDELRVRIHAGERVVSLEQQLREVQCQLEKLAITDELTGLLNRRAALQRLEDEFTRVEREGHSLSCIILDFDRFKLINDVYGHRMGDEVLRESARRMRSSCRPYDILARYGGEEFLTVLPGITLEQAVQVAERIRHCLSSAPVEWNGVAVRVKASFGVAQVVEGMSESPESLVIRADRALYKAKRQGGDCVCAGRLDSRGEPDSTHDLEWHLADENWL